MLFFRLLIVVFVVFLFLIIFIVLGNDNCWLLKIGNDFFFVMVKLIVNRYIIFYRLFVNNL